MSHSFIKQQRFAAATRHTTLLTAGDSENSRCLTQTQFQPQLLARERTSHKDIGRIGFFSLFVCFCFVCLFVAGFWEDGGPEPVSFIWPHSLSYSCASQWLLCIDSSPYGTKLFHVVLFFVYIYYIYLYVHHTVHVWRRSEDNFKESVLSFHSVGTEVLKSGQSFAFKTRSM